MTTPILYALPAEEDPEPGTPDLVEHGCDYMLLPDGKLEYHYNFFDYTWQLGQEIITARAYFEGGPRTISVDVSATRLQQDASLQPIVRFLQRRFVLISSNHPDDLAQIDREKPYAFRHHLLKDDEL